jgi:hypothetical protein
MRVRQPFKVSLKWITTSHYARRRPHSSNRRSNEEFTMLDVIVLAIGLGFFVLTVGYAYGCERL